MTEPARAPARATPPGLVIRRWRDEADWQVMADVTNTSIEADGRDGEARADQMASRHSHILRFDPRASLHIAELDGRAIAWASGVAEREEGDDIRLLTVTCRVDPSVRRRGIGSALQDLAEADALAHAEAVYADDGRRRVFEAWLRSGERDARAFLERRGYAPMRWGHAMDRDLSEPIPDVPLPPGIVLRDPAPDERMRVMLGWDEASRDTWEYNGVDAETLAQILEDPDYSDFAHWAIAWDGDEPVAGILGYVDEQDNARSGRRRGYVEHIWTRRPWRGRGIAGALIAHSLRTLRDEGLETGHLMVDADNPSGAGSLYARMGFRIVDGGIVVLRRPAD